MASRSSRHAAKSASPKSIGLTGGKLTFTSSSRKDVNLETGVIHLISAHARPLQFAPPNIDDDSSSSN
jgi:hypothetical protein